MIRTSSRIRIRVYAGLLLLGFAALQGTVTSQENGHGVIGRGSRWETDYYVVESKRPGPVVMIVGGIHGNEAAGPRAAEQIRHWRITKGKLIVVPRANKPALRDKTRHTPSLAKDLGNLNRNFPKGDGDAARCELSRALWAFVRSQQPDWLLDLHEGHDFTQINNKSVGSSIIAVQSAEAKKKARKMLDALNETIAEPNKKFVLKGPPVKGSLARSAAERLGVESMILETTYKDQPLSRRARQHRIMVHRFLTELRMAVGEADVLVEQSRHNKTIYVGLYDGGGTGGNGPVALEEDLGEVSDFVLRRVGVPEVSNGALRQFDVLVVPGGSGSKQAAALGNEGRAAIVSFIEKGGGYVGFCAGSYLASNNYTWSLKILDAEVIDRKHWKRGKGQVKIEVTPEGQRFFGCEPGLLDIRYANGPLLAPAEDPNIPDFEALAFYRTEIAKNGAPEGVMKNTPAIVAGRFGKGRVFCSSPHPEYTDGLEYFVRRGVRWAAGR